MYGSSGKPGRAGAVGGGGRGGGISKRNVNSKFTPPSLHRPSASPGGRLPVSGGAAVAGNSSGPTSSNGGEETFSLVTGNPPLNFAMMIRLAPDLVDEIKRVEAQGGTARIKFGANANNSFENLTEPPSTSSQKLTWKEEKQIWEVCFLLNCCLHYASTVGIACFKSSLSNASYTSELFQLPATWVVSVGDKEFRFTWSREMGDLCDIYEERRSGEDGNGLLVESGCAWRKVNVQRVLDESTTNHVKMRSEEAERKLKSRKAIVLDHGNPSMKSQMKAMAAAEANPWKMGFNQQKESPLKKRKTEPPPGAPPRPAYKYGLPTTTPSKGRPSASPVSSPPVPSGDPASPFGNANLLKDQMTVDEVMTAQPKKKTTTSDKETPIKVITSQDKPGCKREAVAKHADLRSMLISLLTENQSKGMSLKALEKAVGDTFTNSARKIEPIIKKIATYEAPGRYFLKPGINMDSFKQLATESGSSPEDNHQPLSGPDKHDQLPAPEPLFSLRADTNQLQEQASIESKPEEASNVMEKVDILHHSPHQSEGRANSSSDSDTDGESGSSDSGSESGSRSRSRSRSPGSRSGSSSDSESDAASNSKEASDEDVDIMTSDDDKESKHKLEASEPGSSTFQVQFGTTDCEPGQFGEGGKDDGHHTDVVDIEKDLCDGDQVAEMTVIPDPRPIREDEKAVRETIPSSTNRPEHKQSQVQTGKLRYATENVSYPKNYSETGSVDKGGFKDEQSNSSGRAPKSKSKRVFDEKSLDDKVDQNKRNKTKKSIHPSSIGRYPAFLEGSHSLSPDKPSEGPCNGLNMQTENTNSTDGTADLCLQNSYNQAVLGKSVSDSQKPDRKIDLIVRGKALLGAERPTKQGESLGRTSKYSERSLQLNEGFPSQRDKVNRDSKDEDGFISDKKARKIPKDGVGDKLRNSVDSNNRKYDSSQPGYSPKNKMGNMRKSPMMNGQGHVLQRELSDLELGELREPLPEETADLKKQFERKGSFKAENRPKSSDHWDFESNKGEAADKIVDLRRSSPLHSKSDTKSHQRIVQPQHRQNHPRVDQRECQYNQVMEVHNRSRQTEVGRSLGTNQDAYGDGHRKLSVGAREQHDIKRGDLPPSTKDSKMQKSSVGAETNDRHKDASSIESYEVGQRRRESSPDKTSPSYTMYEKEEPELKGPIKDIFQYKEYVQEYQEKYDSYCSINKVLESCRNEFMKLGKELEVSKGRDMQRYYDILEQLKDSYRQRGPRHRRLKKIFIVLHEELKHLKHIIKEFAVSYAKDW